MGDFGIEDRKGETGTGMVRGEVEIVEGLGRGAGMDEEGVRGEDGGAVGGGRGGWGGGEGERVEENREEEG